MVIVDLKANGYNTDRGAYFRLGGGGGGGAKTDERRRC